MYNFICCKKGTKKYQIRDCILDNDMIVEDKTAIYISHRLSSCRFCDKIVVFHEGRLIQQGTHEQLVRDQTGKYYEMWNAQAQYYV